MNQIEHLLKQTDSNNKIAGLILAIDYLKKESNDDIQKDLETIYQSMGRKFLFKLLSSSLFINNNNNNNNNEQQINPTSLTLYQVAISITTAMINNPSINNQIIAGILPLLSNIIAQIIIFKKQYKDKIMDTKLNKTLNALNHSIIDCAFMILQCYHNHNNKQDTEKLIRYYVVTKSNHYNQKNAEDANVYSMTMSFLKYLSWNDGNQSNQEQKNEDEEEGKDEHKEANIDNMEQQQQHDKIIKIMEFMILNCKKPNDPQNKSLMIAQKIFIKALVKSYKDCQSKLKFEFPSLILSIFYHLFGDKLSNKDNINYRKDIDEILDECFMEIKDICIGSLASRMYAKHRLDIFKLIQMALLFQKHKWFIHIKPKQNTKNKMDSEKLLLFVLSSVCNEICINLETKPSWNTDKSSNDDNECELYDVLDTNLNIFEKLVSYIISEDDEIDAWISTFSSNTMHSIQQDIHNAIRALFFYVTELKYAVFEKNNDDGLKKINSKKKNKKNDKKKSDEEKKVDKKMEEIQSKFKLLTMNDILNDECLKLLDRILYGITLYLNNDLLTFTDEFCGILPFILCQFQDKYIGIISNVISKMLTNDIAKTKHDDKKYKNMIIKQLYFNDYLFDIVIGKCLNDLVLKLTNGYKHELSELFELENEFLSVSLLIHDVFIFNDNKFISSLFNQDKINQCKFEELINMISRISVTKQTHEIVLPLIFVILRIINKTSNKKLDKFVKNGMMKKHISNLIKIANGCQQYEHGWFDEIAMNLMQLKQN